MNLYEIDMNGDGKYVFVKKVDEGILNISKTNAILSKGYLVIGHIAYVNVDHKVNVWNQYNDYHIFKNIIRNYKINDILK